MKVMFNQVSNESPFYQTDSQIEDSREKANSRAQQNYDGLTNFQSVLKARNSSPNSKIKGQQWALSDSNEDVEPFEMSRDNYQDDSRRRTMGYVVQNRNKILGSHLDIDGFRPSMPIEDRGKYAPTPPRFKERSYSRSQNRSKSPLDNERLPAGQPSGANLLDNSVKEKQ